MRCKKVEQIIFLESHHWNCPWMRCCIEHYRSPRLLHTLFRPSGDLRENLYTFENNTWFHSSKVQFMWSVATRNQDCQLCKVSLGLVAAQKAINPLFCNLLITVHMLTFTPRTLRNSLLTRKDVANRFCKLIETLLSSLLALVARRRPSIIAFSQLKLNNSLSMKTLWFLPPGTRCYHFWLMPLLYSSIHWR